MLLDAGAEINQRTHYGSSALQTALYQGHLNASLLLLERGADIDTLGGEKGVEGLWCQHMRYKQYLKGNGDYQWSCKLAELERLREPIRRKTSDQMFLKPNCN